MTNHRGAALRIIALAGAVMFPGMLADAHCVIGPGAHPWEFLEPAEHGAPFDNDSVISASGNAPAPSLNCVVKVETHLVAQQVWVSESSKNSVSNANCEWAAELQPPLDGYTLGRSARIAHYFDGGLTDHVNIALYD